MLTRPVLKPSNRTKLKPEQQPTPPEALAEAGVNNQIAANRRLAESKRQDLDNSLAIERETSAAKIDGIDNAQDRARASAGRGTGAGAGKGGEAEGYRSG